MAGSIRERLMGFVKINKLPFLLVLSILVCFIIANQLRVFHGGNYSPAVMLLRYLGFLLIPIFFFHIGVKRKNILLYNLSMIAILLISVEVIFYFILGLPARDNKSFEIPVNLPFPRRELGYLPNKDTTIIDTFVHEGDTSFHVHYNFDHFSKRITPKLSDHSDEYALFFGCSIAFGYGLNNDETMPFYYQKNGGISAYNFGYNGHGTNHMLARLELNYLREQVKENNGVAYYIFFEDHIQRAIGTMHRYTSWLHDAPYYQKKGGQIKRKMNFKEGRPFLSWLYETLYQSSIIEYFSIDFPLKITRDHIEIVALMVEESKNLYSKQFGNEDFYVVLLPLSGESSDNLETFIEIIDSLGIKTIDLREYLVYDDVYSLKGDPHPNAKFNEVIAKALFEKKQ